MKFSQQCDARHEAKAAAQRFSMQASHVLDGFILHSSSQPVPNARQRSASHKASAAAGQLASTQAVYDSPLSSPRAFVRQARLSPQAVVP